MRTGRPKAPLVLTDAERVTLEALANRVRTRPHLARRARMILLCGQGLASTVGGPKRQARGRTISKWRGRFVRDRLDGLFDEPRPGAPRTIADTEVERVVIRTLETTPRGQTHWSLRGMAKATGLSRMTISRILACVRLAATSHRDRQAVARSAVDREGARHRGPLHESARACRRAVRGREGANPGAGPHPAPATEAAGADRASDA